MLTDEDGLKIMFSVTAGLVLYDIVRRLRKVMLDATEGWMKR
jgi:hypothetical protein